MDLRTELFNACNSKDFPSHEDLFRLVSKAVNLLENEDESYRPREKSKEKFSGGLLNFCSREPQRPVLVIPDLHARTYFLWHVLNYKISLEGTEVTVLEACEKNLIYLVCVGDIFHSEARCYARWKKAYAEYRNGVILSREMQEEMLENLNLLVMILKLKLACPESFHCLKGNHENVLNEEGRGNHPFYKIAREGEMFHRFLFEKYDDAIIWLLSCFEHSLPLCAVFPNLVVSHAEPCTVLTKSKIINYRKNPEAVLALTWTANGEAAVGSVSKTVKNLVGKNCRQVVWIAGHRPVHGKFALRQRGKFVQIHNPDEENIAVVTPGTKFNPENDMLTVN